MLDLRLDNYVEAVSNIEELAKKEATIQRQLDVISSKWSTLSLSFEPNKKYPNIKAIKRPDVILATLEEHMAQLQTMQGQGKYVAHFLDTVNKWQSQLSTVETVCFIYYMFILYIYIYIYI